MRFSTALSCAFTALLAGHTMAMPFAITPGDVNHVVLTDSNTVNTTQTIQADAVSADASKPKVNMFAAADSDFIELSFINKLSSSNVKAYVTGRDSNNALVMLHPDGTWYYPPATTATTPQPVTENVAIPLGAQGSTVKISLPGYISAGRIWFADGNLQFYTVNAGGNVALVEPSAVNPSDPSSAVNWGFIELTYLDTAIYTNLSYVDFVGLPLGQKLTACDGTVLQAQGVHTQAVDDICADLEEQTCIDGYPWADLCAYDASNNALRVLAPFDYISLYPNAFSDYWTSYVNDVWNHYTTTPLTIDTQVSAGLVNCTVTGDYLNCAGDNRAYAKPSAADIFGCNGGPFAIIGSDNDVHRAVVPRLCAAFHRSTLLISGGNIQPMSDVSGYYTKSGRAANWYSKFVHDYEVDGKGYAFAYDDVTPTGGVDMAGLLSVAQPQILEVTVGGV
ncbi:glucanase B [Aureobasidium pullulans]|uniref:Glucanase B n=1 Tax=Aureobasidium pullulans TaxID=5580 RepID=A0A4S9VXC2_AURPU|nr:glucanase B [Aureobasidium pullulans]THZ37071.1 glucanase B [Aureobasidium pullulans]THZ44926.1 glucanase B [Aureobasidium pullulans]THZ57193.1 glucanase B [Aureobasidium pullulans]